LWNKTIFDSHNNILRSTTEAMSAVLGGANSINVLPYDVSYTISDDLAPRIARNIQHILKEESHFDKVIDPSSGSFYIENLTLSIAQATWDLFMKIENQGGFIKSMQNRFVFDEIEKTAQKRDMLIASRKTSIVGVNKYPNLGEIMVDKITNHIPKHRPDKALKLYRGAQAFEEIRLTTGNYVKNGGLKPKVYIAQYGNLAMRIARIQFVANFFGIAGFEIIEAPLINNIQWTVNDILKNKVDIVAICSSDDEYGDLAPDLVKEIKKLEQDISVVIAGNPLQYIDVLKNVGVDDFIHIKTNALETLKQYQQKLGIKLL
jgi:methylmalonyl-CoA mutase